MGAEARKPQSVRTTRLAGLYDGNEKNAKQKFAKNSIALGKQVGYIVNFILTSAAVGESIQPNRPEITKILDDLNTKVVKEMESLSKQDSSLEEYLQHWQGQMESLNFFVAEAVHRSEQKP